MKGLLAVPYGLIDSAGDIRSVRRAVAVSGQPRAKRAGERTPN